MALFKYHYIELDTKRSPRISLQNIVAGETGNRLLITVTNNGDVIDMSEKENDAWKYRVCLRIDSDLGTRRQDSAEANSGITFIEANTGDHGKINILMSKDSFTAGMNRAVLEIYSKRVNDNDTLICSAEWTFRAAKNPTGENAGTVYPSLIKYENDLRQLVSDAEDAIDACEDATAAANSAASSANSAASAANTAAQGADAAKVAANSAADAATSAALAADGAAQNADTKAAEAEAAAAEAMEAANLYEMRILKPTLTWNTHHTDASGTLELSRAEIAALIEGGTLVVISCGSGLPLLYPHSNDDFLYFTNTVYGTDLYTAEVDGKNIAVTYRTLQVVPYDGSAGDVLTKTANGYVWASLPLYNGGVS